MLRTVRSVAFTLCVLVPLSACAPRYQPREVPVPSTCQPLLQRAADQGVDALDEAELRHLAFCQQQMLLRAEEEQAAHGRFEVRRTQSGYWFSIVSLVLAVVAISVGESN